MDGAREEPEAPTGQVTPPHGSASGSGVKGTVAQPFDGGALNLGWMHTPAKGRVTAPSPLALLRPPWLLPALSALCRGGQRGKGGSENELGFWGSRLQPSFCSHENEAEPSILIERL